MTSVLAVSVGGSYVDLPDPAYQSFMSISNEISKSDRNTSGNLIKERINMKYSVTVEWHGLSSDEKNLIVSLTNPNDFDMRYLSMMDDEIHYGSFYRGNDLEIKGYGKFDGRRFKYYDVSFTLVEY